MSRDGKQRKRFELMVIFEEPYLWKHRASPATHVRHSEIAN